MTFVRSCFAKMRHADTPATAERCPFPAVSAKRCDRLRWHFVGHCSAHRNQLSSLSYPQPDVYSIMFCENETRGYTGYCGTMPVSCCICKTVRQTSMALC